MTEQDKPLPSQRLAAAAARGDYVGRYAPKPVEPEADDDAEAEES